ncbi:MAG: hypothetical protein E4H13_11745, partial [Calditrichales bacterium]
MFEEEQFEESSEHQLSLSDYLRIAYRGRWIIITAFVLVFAVTVVFTMTRKNVYQASTTVLIESKGSMERSLFGADYMMGGAQTTLISNQM